MNITDKNFDSILNNANDQIDEEYQRARADLYPILNASKTCIECIKNRGFSFINSNKDEINDCNSKFPDYNNISWQELINKVLQKQVTIGGKKWRKKTKKNNKNKKISRNRKKTNRRLKCKKM